VIAIGSVKCAIGDKSTWQWWGLASALVVGLLIPLFTVEIPPLLDYPNHLARMFVLAHGADDGFLSQVYEQHWSIIPNIAIDAIMPAMLSVMPLYTAGKVVLAITLLLPVAGTIAYSRAAFGVRSLWPLGAGLVAYNSLFMMGFMNFLISVGGALLAAAAWVWLRRSRPMLAVVILAPAAVGLFFMHIFGLALFGLLIGVQELLELVEHRHQGKPMLRPVLASVATLGAVFAGPAVLYAMSNLATVPGQVVWQPLHWKLMGLFGAFVQYDAISGIGTALLVYGIMRVLARSRQVQVSRAAMLSLVVLIGLYPFVPFELKGTAFIDARLPVMAGFLLFAGFAPRGLSRRAGIGVTAVLSLVFLARLVSLTLIWQGQTTDVAQLRRVIASVPPGSRVLVVTVTQPDAPAYWGSMPVHRLPAAGMMTFMHLPALLVTERDAMWPLLFTESTKQPLSVRPGFWAVTAGEGMAPDYRSLAQDEPSQGPLETAPYLADWPDKFGYVLVLLAGAADDLSRLRPDRLELVDQTDFAALLRVRRPVAVQSSPAPAVAALMPP
jgi:hypothetical protein